MATPRRKLSALTRFFVVPLLLIGVGVRVGLYLAPRQGPAPEPRSAALPRPEASVAAPTPVPTPTLSLAAVFDGNIYPSLLLSLSAAYPEYSRCLTASSTGTPPGEQAELRIESGLFLRPAVLALDPAAGAGSLHPDLPWDFARLRRCQQARPETFVATLSVGGVARAQASIVCTLHSVNEAVTRVATGGAGTWQDTSVCIAAFVNEDHPWISALLQEAAAAGSVRVFSGYQGGPQAVSAQVQAVWDALAAKGLTYVNIATDSAASPVVSTQYVRFLDQSVRDQGANCVDASVLFCSVLRRIGLRPVLIFRPGHCLAGYYEAPDSPRIIAFETTVLGQAPFSAALAQGSRELQATLPFLGTPQYGVVDVALCRQQGISPIPYDGEGQP